MGVAVITVSIAIVCFSLGIVIAVSLSILALYDSAVEPTLLGYVRLGFLALLVPVHIVITGWVVKSFVESQPDLTGSCAPELLLDNSSSVRADYDWSMVNNDYRWTLAVVSKDRAFRKAYSGKSICSLVHAADEDLNNYSMRMGN